MNWYIGQKVVCIKSFGVKYGIKGPDEGEIYHIREIEMHYEREFLGLNEFDEFHLFISTDFVPLEDWNKADDLVFELMNEEEVLV